MKTYECLCTITHRVLMEADSVQEARNCTRLRFAAHIADAGPDKDYSIEVAETEVKPEEREKVLRR